MAQKGARANFRAMKRTLYFGVSLSGLLLISPLGVFAADYLGAEAVLEKLSGKPQSGPQEEKPSDRAQLKRDIETFKKQRASLAPDEAARQWLKLLDRQLNLSAAQAETDFTGLTAETILASPDVWNALPPPAAWDALRKAIESRPESKEQPARELCLRLIAHTLVADRQAQTNDLARMTALAANLTEDETPGLLNAVTQISQNLLEDSNDPNVVMKSLERRLAREAVPGVQFSMPNLVPLVGEEKTTNFLRHVFSTTAVQVSIQQGEETKKIARQMALEMVDQLKAPQWELACSLDAGPLFEALEKKFAPPETDTNQPATSLPDILSERRAQNLQNGGYVQAQAFYLLTLISKNRTGEATALALKLSHGDSADLPSEGLSQLERAGYAKALHDFFYELLSQNPNLPFWSDYIALSAQVEETDKMLDLFRKTAVRDDLNAKRRDSIRQNFYKALLAADHVDEGVAEIQQILAEPKKPRQAYDFEAVSRGDLALTLAKLGRLLNHTNWLEQGIHIAREEAGAAQGQNPRLSEYYTSQLEKALAEFLVDIGRGPDAESLLSDALGRMMASTGRGESYSIEDSPSRVSLAGLASVYYRAGRYSDVLFLLEKAPGWGVNDLAELHDTDVDNIHQHEDSLEDSLRHDVAASLLGLGRKDEAAKIANAILDENGGYDPAYEILLKAGRPGVMQRLDELFARDRFEERPLIWKAVLLEQGGKLEEAEAAARRAISIDPSDGEQGAGRRMRAYAVLADIRKARGDEKEADFFRGAVDAIRLSETADRYYEAGLLKQAVKMYEDSLEKFEGAYCIQSRLALRLAELGKHDEAAEHFRRAYELMPDSFGRVESHCFGCEGAFQGERAQSIAEKVFTALVKSDPQKPQVHYLLGFLRQEEGRYGEALEHFRAAVKLDPDYLNAWKHIESTGREDHLSLADRDQILINMLRLDPLGRHGGHSGFAHATDLRALWTAVESAAKLQPELAKSLYELPASKAENEKHKNMSDEARVRFAMAQAAEFSVSRLDPALAVMQNAVIAPAAELLGGRSSPFE